MASAHETACRREHRRGRGAAVSVLAAHICAWGEDDSRTALETSSDVENVVVAPASDLEARAHHRPVVADEATGGARREVGGVDGGKLAYNSLRVSAARVGEALGKGLLKHNRMVVDLSHATSDSTQHKGAWKKAGTCEAALLILRKG